MKSNFKINIKGVKYTVKIVDKIYSEEAGNILGQADADNKIIYIKEDELKNKRSFIDTLSHELFHAYFYECGLIECFKNEKLVSWLGFHFFDITNNALKVIEEITNEMEWERNNGK